MKTMTCKELGGACEVKFRAETFDEIAELAKAHGMEMFSRGDAPHLEAMGKIHQLMQDPKAMQAWMAEKRKAFEQLPADS